jgi:Raf kinase inhibitor-like YbhB/YbcL family protein
MNCVLPLLTDTSGILPPRLDKHTADGGGADENQQAANPWLLCARHACYGRWPSSPKKIWRKFVKVIFGCLAALALGSAFAAAGDPPTPAGTFVLTSPEFEDNGRLQKKFAGNDKTNANCVGENVSPAFSWSNAPAGTKSFAFLMVDPEGRNGLSVVHWVAYGIPASVSGFAEGEVAKESQKFIGGKSTRNLPTYFGPCTPPGDWHHYTFTLIATDLDAKALQPGMTRDELLTALNGHVLGAAGRIGRFRHE